MRKRKLSQRVALYRGLQDVMHRDYSGAAYYRINDRLWAGHQRCTLFDLERLLEKSLTEVTQPLRC